MKTHIHTLSKRENLSGKWCVGGDTPRKNRETRNHKEREREKEN